MVAFFGSFFLSILMIVGVYRYAQRRPKDAPCTWGEAMVGAFAVFSMAMWAYAVVPHQWLTWADNELGWRASEFFVQAQQDVLGPLESPVAITKLVIRDFVVIGIYGFYLVAHVLLWAVWQGRGSKQRFGRWAMARIGRGRPEDTTAYGRPLAKRA